MANHEKRPMGDKVHLLLAFRRHKNNLGLSNECIRVVINDYDLDLALLEEKCKRLGGIWRIHHTANTRDTKKAKIWLLHKLIESNQFDGCIDSIWKTALLQKECKAENYFMFDVDTPEEPHLSDIITCIQNNNGTIEKIIQTPSRGIHIITRPFDSRYVLMRPYVTLIRDGYYFIKEIK